MTVHITVRLDDDQNARLEALAERRQQSAADLVASAVSALLDDEAEEMAAIEEGLADIRAGRTYDYDEVVADLRAYVAQRMKQATG